MSTKAMLVRFTSADRNEAQPYVFLDATKILVVEGEGTGSRVTLHSGVPVHLKDSVDDVVKRLTKLMEEGK